MPKTKPEQNLFFSINPACLKSIFSNCSKKQLVAFGEEMKAMILAEPNQLTPNQRQMLFKLLKHCKKLYYKK